MKPHHLAGIMTSSGKQFPIPKELEFIDDEDEKRKCHEFKEQLIQF
jgi:hypothetical protein